MANAVLFGKESATVPARRAAEADQADGLIFQCQRFGPWLTSPPFHFAVEHAVSKTSWTLSMNGLTYSICMDHASFKQFK